MMVAKKNYNWDHIYKDYIESGLSKKEFAKSRHIGIANIYEHFKTYEENAPEFRELKLQSVDLQNVEISINDINIVFSSTISEAQLATIVKAVALC